MDENEKALELEPGNADFEKRLNEAREASPQRTMEDLKKLVKEVLGERNLRMEIKNGKENIERHEGEDRVFFSQLRRRLGIFRGEAFVVASPQIKVKASIAC